jgi:hypothetical protein
MITTTPPPVEVCEQKPRFYKTKMEAETIADLCGMVVTPNKCCGQEGTKVIGYWVVPEGYFGQLTTMEED